MRGVVALLLTVFSLGCGAGIDAPTLPRTKTDVAGTYFLRTANGVEVPFTAFETATERWRLVRDQLVVRDDKTWSETTSYVVTAADQSSTERETVVSGTWGFLDDHIYFIMTAGGTETFRGSVNDSGLVMLYKNQLFAYVK